MNETWLYHYDPETKQQSIEWRHSGSPSPAPKKIWVQKSSGKVLASFFGDQDSILLIYYLPKGQSINEECYSFLLVQLEDILKENRPGKLIKVFLFLNDNASAHRALATQKKLAYLGFHFLDPHPILRIWSRRTTTCSLDWKNNWKVANFRPMRMSLLPRRPGWTDNILNCFWVACKSYSNGLRSVLSFVGSMLNKSRVWSL